MDISTGVTVTPVEKLTAKFVSWDAGSIVLEFNRPVDETMATTLTGSYGLSGVSGTNVSVDLGEDGMTVTFTVKDESFAPGDVIDIVAGMKDATFPGNTLGQRYAWTLEAGGGATMTAPTP